MVDSVLQGFVRRHVGMGRESNKILDVKSPTNTMEMAIREMSMGSGLETGWSNATE